MSRRPVLIPMRAETLLGRTMIAHAQDATVARRSSSCRGWVWLLYGIGIGWSGAIGFMELLR